MAKAFQHRVLLLIVCVFSQFSQILPIYGQSESTESESQEWTEEENVSSRQIYLDLDAIITSQERSQWILDHVALSKISAELAEVYCQIDARLQSKVLSDFKRAGIDRESAKKLWLSLPKMADGSLEAAAERQFKRALHQERILISFLYAKERDEDCPYWLPKTYPYWGIHRDAGRLQLLAETMGGLQARWRGDELLIGGSGQGRLLTIYGFGASWGLGVGLELGGASVFPRDDNGARSVKAEWAGGVPILARFWIDNYRLDAELTPVARFSDEDQTTGTFGGRFAFAFGLSPLRVLGALPHVMLWGGVERYFDHDKTLVLRAGTRIGFSL